MAGSEMINVPETETLSEGSGKSPSGDDEDDSDDDDDSGDEHDNEQEGSCDRNCDDEEGSGRDNLIEPDKKPDTKPAEGDNDDLTFPDKAHNTTAATPETTTPTATSLGGDGLQGGPSQPPSGGSTALPAVSVVIFTVLFSLCSFLL